MAKKKLYRKHVARRPRRLAEKIDTLRELFPGAFARARLIGDKTSLAAR